MRVKNYPTQAQLDLAKKMRAELRVQDALDSRESKKRRVTLPQVAAIHKEKDYFLSKIDLAVDYEIWACTEANQPKSTKHDQLLKPNKIVKVILDRYKLPILTSTKNTKTGYEGIQLISDKHDIDLVPFEGESVMDQKKRGTLKVNISTVKNQAYFCGANRFK